MMSKVISVRQIQQVLGRCAKLEYALAKKQTSFGEKCYTFFLHWICISADVFV